MRGGHDDVRERSALQHRHEHVRDDVQRLRDRRRLLRAGHDEPVEPMSGVRHDDVDDELVTAHR